MWNEENVCKLGETSDLLNCDRVYVSMEFRRGHFNPVYEMINLKSNHVLDLLRSRFKKYHMQNDFFDKQFMSLIVPFFDSIDLKYKKLSDEEIRTLIK